MKARPWTPTDLVVVVCILGTLATIALPFHREARLRAAATDILNDHALVRASALVHHATHATLPASHDWGVLPGGLGSALPADFSFARDNYEYRWQVWTGGTLGGEFPGMVAGLAVRSTDFRLIAAVRSAFDGHIVSVTPDRVMLLY